MRYHFDEQLTLLKDEMVAMGALCQQVIALTDESLSQGNAALAQQVFEIAPAIDRKERDIESLCLKLLLHQQPVAHDLRQVSGALKMITDMERIGDQAEDIAEIIRYLNGHRLPEEFCLRDMAHVTAAMVADSMQAYIRQDMALAEAVIRRDDQVDDYFHRMKELLTEQIANNSGESKFALDLLMISKYFERIGDHAVNLAEWVIFTITGYHKEVL